MGEFWGLLSGLAIMGYLLLGAMLLSGKHEDSVGLLAGWNSLVLLCSLLVFPWIVTGGMHVFDNRLSDLSSVPFLPEIMEIIPDERIWSQTPILAALLTCPASDVAECLNGLPEGPIREYAQLARNQSAIRAFHLVAPTLGGESWLRLILSLLLLWSLLHWVWLGMSYLQPFSSAYREIVRRVLLGIGVFLIPLLLWHVPLVDTLGDRETFGFGVVVYLSEARVGPGIGWALISLIFGLLLTLWVPETSVANGEPEW